MGRCRVFSISLYTVQYVVLILPIQFVLFGMDLKSNIIVTFKVTSREIIFLETLIKLLSPHDFIAANIESTVQSFSRNFPLGFPLSSSI